MAKPISDLRFYFTPISRNEKTGPMPVTTTEQSTCPTSCPFHRSNAGGCYANGGPLKLLWDRISDGRDGIDFEELCKSISKLGRGTIWRMNQAGDLPGDGELIDPLAMRKLILANAGKRGFTYTHYDVETDAENRAIVADANRKGFTVNLSANSPAHADELVKLDAGPVTTVLPAELQRTIVKKEFTEDLTEYRKRIADVRTPEGRKVTVCPATYRDDVNCATCQLCQKVEGRAIVGFPAHGASKRKATNAVAADAVSRSYAIAAE